MSLSPVFQENLQLLSRFGAEMAGKLVNVPLSPPGVRKEIGSEWPAPAALKVAETLFIYGISPLGEEYLRLKRWLQENDSRTLVFLVDDFSTARTFMETSTATEMLRHQQVIINLFQWPKEPGWSPLKEEFEWLFKMFSVGKTVLVPKADAATEEKERAGLLSSVFQRNIDDWLRTYHNYLVAQSEAFDSYYLNLLELLNAKFGQAMTGAFKGVPAIICGAGPSLGQHLDKLRSLQDRALIFGSGSGLNVLSRHGILPHFAGGVDATPTQVSRISTNFAFQVPFFYLNRFNNEALRLVQGEKLVARGGIRLHAIDWLDEQLGLASYERVHLGMSTSNFCFEVASFLGCNPIVLVGMDLCYKGDVRYAPGVTAHPAEERKHHTDIGQAKTNLRRAQGLDGSEVITSWDWLLEAECFTGSAAQHPNLQVWNATEGGMPIHGIPNITLQEAIDRFLGESYAFDPLIHELIQSHPLDFINKERLQSVFEEWKQSLAFCREKLLQRLQMLQQLSATAEGKSIDAFTVDLQQLLGETPANTHCLKQINDIFNGLNGRAFFRLAHYPESYPPGRALETVGMIEKERCRFLIEKLEFHLKKSEEALRLIPGYPTVPRAATSSRKGRLVEEKEGGERRYYYATGELYAVKRFRRDVLHGKQEFFFVDGATRTVMHYRDGLLDGKVYLYYYSGMPKRELHFVRGQLDGQERLWDRNGTLIREVYYQNNQPVGTAKSWHPNGILAREVVYGENADDYEVTEWDERGVRVTL